MGFRVPALTSAAFIWLRLALAETGLPECAEQCDNSSCQSFLDDVLTCASECFQNSTQYDQLAEVFSESECGDLDVQIATLYTPVLSFSLSPLNETGSSILTVSLDGIPEIEVTELEFHVEAPGGLAFASDDDLVVEVGGDVPQQMKADFDDLKVELVSSLFFNEEAELQVATVVLAEGVEYEVLTLTLSPTKLAEANLLFPDAPIQLCIVESTLVAVVPPTINSPQYSFTPGSVCLEAPSPPPPALEYDVLLGVEVAGLPTPIDDSLAEVFLNILVTTMPNNAFVLDTLTFDLADVEGHTITGASSVTVASEVDSLLTAALSGNVVMVEKQPAAEDGNIEAWLSNANNITLLTVALQVKAYSSENITQSIDQDSFSFVPCVFSTAGTKGSTGSDPMIVISSCDACTPDLIGSEFAGAGTCSSVSDKVLAVAPIYKTIFVEGEQQNLLQQANPDAYTSVFSDLCADPQCALAAIKIVNEQCDAPEVEEYGVLDAVTDYMCKIQEDGQFCAVGTSTALDLQFHWFEALDLNLTGTCSVAETSPIPDPDADTIATLCLQYSCLRFYEAGTCFTSCHVAATRLRPLCRCRMLFLGVHFISDRWHRK